MRDDASWRHQRAQGEQLAQNDRLQRLNQVIRVDSRVHPAELPVRCQPLQSACPRSVLAGDYQSHVANLRITGAKAPDLVAILRITGVLSQIHA